MLTRTLALTTAIAATSIFAGLAQAGPLIYESFSQDAGSLNGVAGELGLNTWSANNGTSVVATPTLDYGDLANAGGQLDFPLSAGTDAWVTTTSVLGDNGLLADGATLWFSYMFQKFSGGGANEKGGFALGTDRLDGAYNGTNMTNSGNGIGVMTNGASVSAAAWSGGGNGSTGGSIGITYGDSVLIVGKIEWGATEEKITIYTPDTSDLGNLGTGAVKTVTGFDQSVFDTVSMTQRNSGDPGDQVYDEIRFGATYEDVTPIPEPASLALIGLGGLVMLARRR
jgi:hypothetical protein